MKRKKNTKVTTSTKLKPKKGYGKRLTDSVKADVVKAGNAGATLATLASTFGVSVPTISRIIGPRRGKKPRGRPQGAQQGFKASGAQGLRGMAAGDVSVEFSGDVITITLPRTKKALVKSLLGDLI